MKAIKLLVLLLIIALFVIFARDAQSEKVQSYKEYTVQANDTLWGIVSENYDNTINKQEKIYQIKKINNLSSSELKIGQKIVLIVE